MNPGDDGPAPAGIKAGDVVVLRAGGAPMNVRTVSDKYALCSWYDLVGRRHIDVFRLDTLALVESLPDPPLPGDGPHTEVQRKPAGEESLKSSS
jgi:uncharacterized protein YodC (DUF2158 family)